MRTPLGLHGQYLQSAAATPRVVVGQRARETQKGEPVDPRKLLLTCTVAIGTCTLLVAARSAQKNRALA